MTKAIVLKREVNGKTHKTLLKQCNGIHIELVERLYYRVVNKGIIIDIDVLIDSIDSKGYINENNQYIITEQFK